MPPKKRKKKFLWQSWVKEGDNFFLVKSFFSRQDKVVPISEKDFSFNAPMVVDEIGVEKIHTPALFGRWKAAQEQHATVGGKERLQRMFLDGYVVGAVCHW